MTGPLWSWVLVLGAWAALHSLLLADPVKARLAPLLGPAPSRYRLAYNLFSLASLGLSFALLPRLPGQVWQATGDPALLLHLLRLASALLFLWTFKGLNLAEFTGLPGLGGKSSDGPPVLLTGGAYRLCRHPMYLFGTLFLWLNPDMTVEGLVFALWATVYFLLGSLHEERRLARLYGEAYRAWAAGTPMFLPNLRLFLDLTKGPRNTT